MARRLGSAARRRGAVAAAVRSGAAARRLGVSARRGTAAQRRGTARRGAARRGATRRDTTRHDTTTTNGRRSAVAAAAAQRLDGGAAAEGGGGLWPVGRGAHVVFICFVLKKQDFVPSKPGSWARTALPTPPLFPTSGLGLVTTVLITFRALARNLNGKRFLLLCSVVGLVAFSNKSWRNHIAIAPSLFNRKAINSDRGRSRSRMNHTSLRKSHP